MSMYDGTHSKFGMFITLILFGLLVVCATGLGLLTNAIFNLKKCGCASTSINQTTIDIINSLPDSDFVDGISGKKKVLLMFQLYLL